MDRKIKILLLLLLTQLNTQCQMMEQTPEFDVEITHPNPKYLITPVFDYIKTLEGTLEFLEKSGQIFIHPKLPFLNC